MPKGEYDSERRARGTQHGRAKLTEEQVIYCRKAWRDCPRDYWLGLATHLAEKFGIARGNMDSVCRGETWRHLEISEDKEPFDKELLAELQERRKENDVARRTARSYQGGTRCSQNKLGPHSTMRPSIDTIS